MRSLAFISLCSFATLVAAQAQQPRQEQQNLDKQAVERLRVERAAGGVRQITPEEKANANAGAGPHDRRQASGKSNEVVEQKGAPSNNEQSSSGKTR